MSFQQTLQMGKTGEGYVANWLKTRGFNVLPIYEIEQGQFKGPALYAVAGTFVAPDMLVFKPTGKTIWIEAKTKSAFSWHRQTKRWVTGIDLHNYEDYLQVQAVSPWPVWLLFLQQAGQAKDSPSGCPTGLYGNTLDYLHRNENHRHANGGKDGMVYWAVTSLRRLADLADIIPVSASRG